MSPALYPELTASCERLSLQFADIPPARQAILTELARSLAALPLPLRLTFICTHNSRRSHMAQLWAQAAAYNFSLYQVETFSGGTEATAFNLAAKEALQQQGFRFEYPDSNNANNTKLLATFGPALPGTLVFSKVYNHPHNPQRNFAALLTCTEADEGCPVVVGASLRLSLPYTDPKLADGSPQQNQTYQQRAEEIGREMLYLFSQLKPHLTS